MSNESYNVNDLQVHFKQIEKAAAHLEGILSKTNLIHSSFLSKEYGNNIYLKPENLQITGSFKIRGAYNKIINLTENEKSHGIIASSAGNHAQGVAYSGEKLGIPSYIVMPNVTPLIKIEGTRSYGAEVIVYGNIYDEAYEKAMELSESEGYTFVHPFNDYDVIHGQGTIGLEIVRELESVEEILVPVGGGGLVAGIALAVKALNPNIRVIGVEPEGAKAMKASIDSKELVQLSSVNTMAEGVAVKTPGDIPFEIVKEYVDDIVIVSEADIMEASLLLFEKHKLIAETAGVLPIAALKNINSKGKNIVSLLSGGNIDVVTISSVINKGLIARGRILCFTVDLPDKPGQLLKVAQILADLGANVIQLDHNQFKAIDRFMNVQLEIIVETNGHLHIQRILETLSREGFPYNKIY